MNTEFECETCNKVDETGTLTDWGFKCADCCYKSGWGL